MLTGVSERKERQTHLACPRRSGTLVRQCSTPGKHLLITKECGQFHRVTE